MREKPVAYKRPLSKTVGQSVINFVICFLFVGMFTGGMHPSLRTTFFGAVVVAIWAEWYTRRKST